MTASTKAKPDLDAIEGRARETARRLGLGEEPEEWEIAELTEQIRQAEQAARRKTLEQALSAVGQKSPAVSRDEVLRILRALANQPSEPGEAA